MSAFFNLQLLKEIPSHPLNSALNNSGMLSLREPNGKLLPLSDSLSCGVNGQLLKMFTTCVEENQESSPLSMNSGLWFTPFHLTFTTLSTSVRIAQRQTKLRDLSPRSTTDALQCLEFSDSFLPTR